MQPRSPTVGQQLKAAYPMTVGVGRALAATLSTKILKERKELFPNSSLAVAKFGEAFITFIEPILDNSRKDKKLQSQGFITKYIYELTRAFIGHPTPTSSSPVNSPSPTSSTPPSSSSPSFRNIFSSASPPPSSSPPEMEKKEKKISLEDDFLDFNQEKFQSEILTSGWVEEAKRVWFGGKEGRWAEIINKTQEYISYRLTQKHANHFTTLFSKYVSFLKTKKWAAKEILEKISINFLQFISEHEVDFPNAFIGCCPSLESALMTKVLRPGGFGASNIGFSELHSLVLRSNMIFKMDLGADKVAKEMAEMTNLLRARAFMVKGSLVAFPSSFTPPYLRSYFVHENENEGFVFARAAESFSVHNNSQNIKLYIDPMETTVIEIPIENLYRFHSNLGEKFIENPLNKLSRTVFPLAKNLAVQLMKQAGVNPKCFGENQEYNLSDLEWLSVSREAISGVLKSLAGSEDSILDLVEILKDAIKQWINDTPTAFFPSCYLNETLEELQSFFAGLPELLLKTVKNKKKFIDSQFYKLLKLLEDIISGEKKNEVCSWWLELIERRVDDYLQALNFDLDAVPDDYTTTKPPNMEKVRENLALIQSVRTDSIDELSEFVDKVTDEVYVVLSTLKTDLQYVLSEKWKEVGVGDGGCFGFQGQKESLEKDLEYMEEMRKMDDEIKEKRREGKMEGKPLEMTSVVPVSGLVLARFHVHANEHATAIDLWDPQVSEEDEESSSSELTIVSFVTFSGDTVTELCASAILKSSAEFEADSKEDPQPQQSQKEGEGFLAFISSTITKEPQSFPSSPRQTQTTNPQKPKNERNLIGVSRLSEPDMHFSLSDLKGGERAEWEKGVGEEGLGERGGERRQTLPAKLDIEREGGEREAEEASKASFWKNSLLGSLVDIEEQEEGNGQKKEERDVGRNRGEGGRKYQPTLTRLVSLSHSKRIMRESSMNTRVAFPPPMASPSSTSLSPASSCSPSPLSPPPNCSPPLSGTPSPSSPYSQRPSRENSRIAFPPPSPSPPPSSPSLTTLSTSTSSEPSHSFTPATFPPVFPPTPRFPPTPTFPPPQEKQEKGDSEGEGGERGVWNPPQKPVRVKKERG